MNVQKMVLLLAGVAAGVSLTLLGGKWWDMNRHAGLRYVQEMATDIEMALNDPAYMQRHSSKYVHEIGEKNIKEMWQYGGRWKAETEWNPAAPDGVFCLDFVIMPDAKRKEFLNQPGIRVTFKYDGGRLIPQEVAVRRGTRM